MVKPIIWDKWCDGACAFGEPTQETDNFRPGIAQVVCYSPIQDLPQDNLRDKKTISMSLVYVPEHWVLPSFMEAAYVVNRALDTNDPRGMMSLARIHKRSPFYPDISFREYKQHLTIMPLMPPTENGLGYCRYTEDFAVGTLHERQDYFCKVEEITSWAPPAFQKAPPGELVLITGSGSKTWGYTGRTPECHIVPMAPLDSFIQLKTTEDGEPILPEYAFALCLPGSWPFPSLMDQTILLESYLSEGNPGEETNANNSTKKTHNGRARRPREDPKVPGPQAVLPKSARPESKQILKLARMVPSRSCKSYIFPPKGPIQTPRRAQVRLLRMPTRTIPGWALPFLPKSRGCHPEHRVLTRCQVRVKIH